MNINLTRIQSLGETQASFLAKFATYKNARDNQVTGTPAPIPVCEEFRLIYDRGINEAINIINDVLPPDPVNPVPDLKDVLDRLQALPAARKLALKTFIATL